MPYMLDANVFIQAKNREYGFDFCPAFWEWLDLANGAGIVFSVDQVRAELLAGADEVADWARAHGPEFFRPTDSSVMSSLGTLTEWARDADYNADAKDDFISDAADIYLLANALSYPHTVVTHEVAGGSRKHIKIPDAAAAHGLQCINPYLMLRTERARFILDHAS